MNNEPLEIIFYKEFLDNSLRTEEWFLEKLKYLHELRSQRMTLHRQKLDEQLSQIGREFDQAVLDEVVINSHPPETPL